jgi:hypothetical protein
MAHIPVVLITQLQQQMSMDFSTSGKQQWTLALTGGIFPLMMSGKYLRWH